MASVARSPGIDPVLDREATSERRGDLEGRQVQACSCTPITSRIGAIASLVGHIILGPLFIAESIIELTIRAISCGRCCKRTSDDELRSGLVQMTGDLFTLTLQSINPNADIATTNPSKLLYPQRFNTLSDIGYAYQLMSPITTKAHQMAWSTSFFARHVTARGLFLVEFLGGLPLRIADVALGLLATPFALITCGSSSRLNRVAQLGWASIGAIPGDAIHFITKMISPQLTI